MAAIDVVNRVLREFRRYTGDGLPSEPAAAPLPVGDPSSGVHNPKKSELRTALLAPVQEAEDAADRAEEARDEAVAAVSYNPVIVRFTTTNAGPYDMGVGNTIGSANMLDVKVGGVWQDHDKYTVAGTTFTFTSDPGADLEMEAVLRADIRQIDTPADGSVLPVSLGASTVDYLDTRYIDGTGDELPTICLTFDYYVEASTTAKTIMETYGLVGTYYVTPSTIDTTGPTRGDLALMKALGWEIGAYSGTNWVTAEAADRLALLDDMKALKDDMDALGLPVTSLAPNQRAWNQKLAYLVEGYFTHVRVVDNFRATDGYWQALPVLRNDRLWIKRGGSASLSTSDTGASLSAQVDDLIALGGLWTVIVHRVAESGDASYRIPAAEFTAFCAKIADERDAGNLRVVRFCDL